MNSGLMPFDDVHRPAELLGGLVEADPEVDLRPLLRGARAPERRRRGGAAGHARSRRRALSSAAVAASARSTCRSRSSSRSASAASARTSACRPWRRVLRSSPRSRLSADPRCSARLPPRPSSSAARRLELLVRRLGRARTVAGRVRARAPLARGSGGFGTRGRRASARGAALLAFGRRRVRRVAGPSFGGGWRGAASSVLSTAPESESVTDGGQRQSVEIEAARLPHLVARGSRRRRSPGSAPPSASGA